MSGSTTLHSASVVSTTGAQSTGQEAEEPVQVSAGSQTPAEPRHKVPAVAKESAGQETELPVPVMH